MCSDALTLTFSHVMYITLALNTIKIGGTKDMAQNAVYTAWSV
jgi:hypothetical protein